MIWQVPHYCGREDRKICHHCATTASAQVSHGLHSLPERFHLTSVPSMSQSQTQTSLMPGPRIFPPSCIRVVSPSCPGVLLSSPYQGVAQVCNPGTVVKQEKKKNKTYSHLQVPKQMLSSISWHAASLLCLTRYSLARDPHGRRELRVSHSFNGVLLVSALMGHIYLVDLHSPRASTPP